MSEVEHPHLAVMFTDIKDYSKMMSEDESQALRVLREHNQIMESVIDAHDGRIIKKLGDSYMVIFQQGDAAVKCGLHALNKIAARNRNTDKAVEIRVGIHEGAMLERDGDFFGENVNIAARLEQLAAPMTIAASERVLADVATRVKCEARFIGAQSLKNIRYPVSIYQLTPADAWQLYLSADGPLIDDAGADLLGDLHTAEEAWQEIDRRLQAGHLDHAAQLADSALSRFGGTYGDYARLAAIYLLARLHTEAQKTLKIGEMLGRSEESQADYEWLRIMAGRPDEALRNDPQALRDCLEGAQACVAANPLDLSMAVLLENLKARATGQTTGFKALLQRHPDTAVVLRGYAEALHDHGDHSGAHSMLHRAIQLAPDVAEHQLRRVEWMIDDGDLEAVVEHSSRLAAAFPEHPRVYEWTGKTRLLHLDPHGAQWVFEQRPDSGGAGSPWRICSLIQQGRFNLAVDLARKEMRSAIRQNLQRLARTHLRLAISGMYLDHWEGILELLEEYQRYDAEWLFPRTALIAAKIQRQLMPWQRGLGQLEQLATDAHTPYPHHSAVTAMALLPVVQHAEQWAALHQCEFLKAHRNWIIDHAEIDAALVECRGSLRFDTVDTWHLQVAELLMRLRMRLDHRLPSLLALAGLIRARLNDFDGGREALQQARKLWHSADWPVWEIQEAETALATGGTTPVIRPPAS